MSATTHDRELQLQARLQALTASPAVMRWKAAHHGFIAVCLGITCFGLAQADLTLFAWIMGALAMFEALRSATWARRSIAK